MAELERGKIVEAWVDCVSLFHDALFEPQRMEKWRQTQLSRLLEDVETNREKKGKFFRNKSKYHLLEVLHSSLSSLYLFGDINAYNLTIQTSEEIAFYCHELGLVKEHLELTADQFNYFRENPDRGHYGAQELATTLIEGAAKSESASLGMSRSAQLDNRSKTGSSIRALEDSYAQYGSRVFKNQIEELALLSDVFYRAQWFSQPDKQLELRIVPKPI